MKRMFTLLMALIGSLLPGFARGQYVRSPCTLVVNPQRGNWCVDSNKLVPQVYSGTRWQPWGRSLNWRGAWSSTVIYSPMDIATSDGSIYVSFTSSNINHTPGSNLSKWGLLASVGAAR